MKRVLIESPYAGDIEKNVNYAKKCMMDSFKRGEAPFLSHLLYTQVLNDNIPEERKQGIEAGLLWGSKADFTAVYIDLGISKGMQQGILKAKKEGRQVVFRQILTSSGEEKNEK